MGKARFEPSQRNPFEKERTSPNGNERASRAVPSSRKRIVDITRSSGRNRRRKSQSRRRNDLSWNGSNRKEGNGRENEERERVRASSNTKRRELRTCSKVGRISHKKADHPVWRGRVEESILSVPSGGRARRRRADPQVCPWKGPN